MKLTAELKNSYARGLRFISWTCPTWDTACGSYTTTALEVTGSVLQNNRATIETTESKYCLEYEGAEKPLCIVLYINFDPDLPSLSVNLVNKRRWRSRFNLRNRRLKFRLQPDDWSESVEWSQYDLQWTLMEEECSTSATVVPTEGVNGFRTRFNKFVIKRDTLKPDTDYCLQVVVQKGGVNLMTSTAEFGMSWQFERGWVKVKPRGQVDNRQELTLVFKSFARKTEFEVFCQLFNDPLSRQYIEPTNSRGYLTRFKGIYLRPSTTHECGYVYTDRNRWTDEAIFDFTVNEAPLPAGTTLEQELLSLTSVNLLIAKSGEISTNFGTTEEVQGQLRNAVSESITNEINSLQNGSGGFDPEDLEQATAQLGTATDVAGFETDQGFVNKIAQLVSSVGQAVNTERNSLGDADRESIINSMWKTLSKTMRNLDTYSSDTQLALESAMQTVRTLAKDESEAALVTPEGALYSEEITTGELITGQETEIEAPTTGSLSGVKLVIKNEVISELGTSAGAAAIGCEVQNLILDDRHTSALDTFGTVTNTNMVVVTFSKDGVAFQTNTVYTVNIETTPPPSERNLQTGSTTTVTTYTPACMRFDSTTSTWTSTGVTTQVNADGTVACQASLAGAVTVVYTATTTTITTPTTTTASSSGGMSMAIIGAIAGVAVLLIVAVIVIIVVCKKRKQKKARRFAKSMPSSAVAFEEVMKTQSGSPVRMGSGKSVNSTDDLNATIRPLAARDISSNEGPRLLQLLVPWHPVWPGHPAT